MLWSNVRRSGSQAATFISVVALVGLAVALMISARSQDALEVWYAGEDNFGNTGGAAWGIHLGFYAGGVYLLWSDITLPPLKDTQATILPQEAGYGKAWTTTDERLLLGLAIADTRPFRLTDDIIKPDWAHDWLGFRLFVLPNKKVGRGFTAVIPVWCLLLVAAILPTRKIVLMAAQHRRLRQGLCPQCGYDLHASPDRCPECGAFHHRKSFQAK